MVSTNQKLKVIIIKKHIIYNSLLMEAYNIYLQKFKIVKTVVFFIKPFHYRENILNEKSSYYKK